MTSSARNDSGLFDGPGDDRYLPFEGSGAVSRWRLELAAGARQFDYDSISDVVLHLRYTARDGGLALRSAATAAVQARIAAASAVGPARLLDVRHEFPTEWARFVISVPSGQPSPVPPAPAPLTLTLREEHYPYWASLAAGYWTRWSSSPRPGPGTSPCPVIRRERGPIRRCGPIRASAACAAACSPRRCRPPSAS